MRRCLERMERMNIEIKALTPELEEVYFDFFDNIAFSDGSPYYPCYCNAFNMSKEQKTGNGPCGNQLLKW